MELSVFDSLLFIFSEANLGPFLSAKAASEVMRFRITFIV